MALQLVVSIIDSVLSAQLATYSVPAAWSIAKATLYSADPWPTFTDGGFRRQPDVVVALQVAPSMTETASAPLGATVAA